MANKVTSFLSTTSIYRLRADTYHFLSREKGVLLPVSSKIFCRMLLDRIKLGVDNKLRKEQAGFKPKIY